MFRKISTIVLMAAIVVAGVIAFVSLHYLANSAKIFQFTSDQHNFRSGHGGFEGRERHEQTDGARRDFEFRERPDLPDSLRNKFSDRRNFDALPDSLRQTLRRDDFPGEHGSFRGGYGGDSRGGDFRGGGRISLGKASGFLAVFALFTIITIGIDKGFKHFRNRNKINK